MILNCEYNHTTSNDMNWLLQLEDLFTTWLMKAKENNTATVTADEIVEMGKLARGATDEHIDGMSVELYA